MSTSLVPQINSEERGGVVVLQLDGETIEIRVENPKQVWPRAWCFDTDSTNSRPAYVSYFVGAIDERF